MSRNAHLLHFEDFRPGEVKEYGRYAVTKEEIIAFAEEFDPQPFHLDEQAAKASLLGGLAASGWHTCAMVTRINCDAFVLNAASLGAPGVTEVKWLKPVRPGDVLSVRCTILDARPSRTRQAMGLVEFSFEVLNQARIVVMTQRNFLMLLRRGAEHAALPRSGGAERRPAPAPGSGLPASGAEARLSYYDDLVIGTQHVLGAHTFERDEIVAFAHAYDPQPFHIDEEAAREGPFGALTASGWHTAARWMRLYVDWGKRAAAAMAYRGEPVRSNGPSPGFRDLKWLKPVYAGDTITFKAAIAGKRAIPSRHNWGLVISRNSGVNQHGALVFEFSGAELVERRPH